MSKAIAYTDGSYNKDTGNYGCGVVLIVDGGEPILMHAQGRAKPGENGWQVNGEIDAAIMAVKKAIKLECSEITIFHDYDGVGKWADGLWRTNKKYTRRYASEINQLRKQIRITFTHVKGHAGNRYNEMADQQAKISAGLIKDPESTVINSSPPSAPVKQGNTPVSLPDGLNEDGKRNILRFLRIKNPSFRDFVTLKTGGLDKFSRMPVPEIEAALGEGVCEEIKAGIHDQGDYAAALRWAVRGLSTDDAAHKVNVDHEVRENAIRR